MLTVLVEFAFQLIKNYAAMSTSRIIVAVNPPKPSFLGLPDDVLIQILSKLDGSGLASMSQVNKRLLKLILEHPYEILEARVNRNNSDFNIWFENERLSILFLSALFSETAYSIARTRLLCNNRNTINTLSALEQNQFHAKFEHLMQHALEPNKPNPSLGIALSVLFSMAAGFYYQSMLALTAALTMTFFPVLYKAAVNDREYRSYNTSLLTLFQDAEHQLKPTGLRHLIENNHAADENSQSGELTAEFLRQYP